MKEPGEEPDLERVARLWEARSLPPSERRAFIQSITADPRLGQELESLLAGAGPAERLFERFGALLHDAAENVPREEAAAAVCREVAPSGSGGAPDPDLWINRTFAQYRIDARIGEGGMGVVYRAYDTRLERTVALKFLPSRLTDNPLASARFLTEARAAAGLDHPNICTVHEIGGDDTTPPFIAMAYCRGRSLAQLLESGPLPIAIALDHALQVARALSAAHTAGVVHCDVKPRNIMVCDDGVVKLLDFGIAHTAIAAPTPSGAVPGTLAYMSPEQVTGRPVDARTDLWSLGAVLYEMCTGQRPFAGEDAGATLSTILHVPLVPVSSVTAGVPARVDRIIDRLLRKSPDERFQDAAEVAGELAAARDNALESVPPGSHPRRRRILRLSLAAAASVTAAAAWLAWSVTAPAEPTRLLIADAAGDSVHGPVVTTRLRERLAGPGLIVVGRPSVADVLARMGRHPGERLSADLAREVALREGLERVVHLTVDRIGPAFTLGAIVVDAPTGDILDHHEATALTASDLPDATDRLGDAIRRALGPPATEDRTGAPLLAVTADSLSALQRQLQAVQANRDGDYLRGIALLDDAIAIDPGFADAYQTRAFALEQIGLRAGRAQRSLIQARERVGALRPYERYLLDADYRWHVEGDLEAAIAALRNAHGAIDLAAPGRVLNRRSYGLALMLHGDLMEAEQVLQVGRRFAPCPATNTHLVSVLYAMGRAGDARDVLSDALDRWPTNPWLGMDRAHFHAIAGRYRDAHREAQRLEHGFTLPFALRAEATFDAVEGRVDEAAGHLRALAADRLRHGLLNPALEVAAALGRLRLVAGDTGAALAGVEQFLGANPIGALDPSERPYLSVALFFASARAAPRASELLADYDTLVPAEFKAPDRWMRHRVRAALAMAVDSPAIALRELREARESHRIWSEWFDNLLLPIDQRPELGLVYERLGQPDSAVAVYTRFLNAPVLYRAEMDAFHLAHVLRRLAALHEQRNEPRIAARYTRRLADLWGGADPALKARWQVQ